MFLFWFLVVLSVYFEIFCNKICLDTEKMVEKMWKICRKIAFLENYKISEIDFQTIFYCRTKHLDFILFMEIHFPLHSFYTRNSIYIELNAPLTFFSLFIFFSSLPFHWTRHNLRLHLVCMSSIVLSVLINVGLEALQIVLTKKDFDIVDYELTISPWVGRKWGSPISETKVLWAAIQDFCEWERVGVRLI